MRSRPARSAARSAATRSPARPPPPCLTASRRPGSAIAAELPFLGDVCGLGPMLAREIARDDDARSPAPELAAATAAARASAGLLLLTSGSDGNVIRLLPPLTIADADLADGPAALEAALREVR